MVEVDGSALDGTCSCAKRLRGVEVELVSLSASSFVGAERVRGLLSAMAAERVLCSGEGVCGGGAFVGGAAAVSAGCVTR